MEGMAAILERQEGMGRPLPKSYLQLEKELFEKRYLFFSLLFFFPFSLSSPFHSVLTPLWSF